MQRKGKTEAPWQIESGARKVMPKGSKSKKTGKGDEKNIAESRWVQEQVKMK